MPSELTKELAGYDGRAIANYILSVLDAQKFEISNKKINKLIYFVHGYFIARFNRVLIRNYFEAWEHGPVVRVVYDSFKKFRFGVILNPAIHVDVFEQVERPVSFDSMTPDERRFIFRVALHYARYPANQLEDMTHQPGTPWAITRAKAAEEPLYQNRIANDLIREHFAAQIGAKSRLQ